MLQGRTYSWYIVLFVWYFCLTEKKYILRAKAICWPCTCLTSIFNFWWLHLCCAETETRNNFFNDLVGNYWWLIGYYLSGSEAMFADLCYFSVRSVQVIALLKFKRVERVWQSKFFSFLRKSYLWIHLYVQLTFVFLVLPCLLLGYLGQAAFLMENQSQSVQVFFSSIPSQYILFYHFWSRNFPSEIAVRTELYFMLNLPSGKAKYNVHCMKKH